MRLGMVADVHVSNFSRFGGPVEAGLNRRCRQTLGTLRGAVIHAEKMKCDALAVLGDLTDTARPEPQVIAGIQRALETKLPIYMVMGNHDQVSTALGDHVLGPYSPISEVIEKPVVVQVVDAELWVVPFQPGKASEWLPEAVKGLASGHQQRGNAALLLHVGLSTHDTPVWLKDSHDQVPALLVGDLCKEYGLSVAFAGNWHEHRVFAMADRNMTKVVQVGALCPTGFDNPGLVGYGSLIIWDSNAKGSQEALQRVVVSGPRFIKGTLKDCQGYCYTDYKNEFFYVTPKVPPEQIPEAQAWLEEMISERWIIDGEVLIDDVKVKSEAQAAASAARSAETLDQALEVFIKDMPLSEQVDRASVMARCKKYLGR